MSAKKTIYQAGIASGNSWSLVGFGKTKAAARADFQKKLAELGYRPFGNYIETQYEQAAA